MSSASLLHSSSPSRQGKANLSSSGKRPRSESTAALSAQANENTLINNTEESRASSFLSSPIAQSHFKRDTQSWLDLRRKIAHTESALDKLIGHSQKNSVPKSLHIDVHVSLPDGFREQEEQMKTVMRDAEKALMNIVTETRKQHLTQMKQQLSSFTSTCHTRFTTLVNETFPSTSNSPASSSSVSVFPIAPFPVIATVEQYMTKLQNFIANETDKAAMQQKEREKARQEQMEVEVRAQEQVMTDKERTIAELVSEAVQKAVAKLRLGNHTARQEQQPTEGRQQRQKNASHKRSRSSSPATSRAARSNSTTATHRKDRHKTVPQERQRHNNRPTDNDRHVHFGSKSSSTTATQGHRTDISSPSTSRSSSPSSPSSPRSYRQREGQKNSRHDKQSLSKNEQAGGRNRHRQTGRRKREQENADGSVKPQRA